MKQQVAIQDKQNIIISCRFLKKKINDVEVFRRTFEKVDYIVKNNENRLVIKKYKYHRSSP